MRFLSYVPRHWWTIQGWKTWASYLHWRLETYGVYYPAGKFNWSAFRKLLRQTPGYLRWVSAFERTRKTPPTPR